MKAATICSGLGCPELAMPEWDWSLASEIETAPRAILTYRHGYSDARHTRDNAAALWGDFTTIRARHFQRLGISMPEWIVAGLPCQAFSIAGLRNSLADARGNLTLEFLRLAQSLRRAGTLNGFLFENVPGILSTDDNAFGCLLAGIVGADDTLHSPFERGRWPGEGMVEGPRARAAWRILDAQYFGLAQRRERVFVVASFVDGIDPAAILFNRLGLYGNHAPRREKGEGLTHDIAPSLVSSGRGVERGVDTRGQDPVVAVQAFGGGNRSGPIEQAACLTAKGQRVDFEVETFVTHALRGEGFDASEDGTGRGVPIVAVEVHPTLNAGGNSTGGPRQPGMSADTADGLIPVAPLLLCRECGEKFYDSFGTSIGGLAPYECPRCAEEDNLVPIAFSCKDYGNDATENLSPTLRSMNHDGSHQNGGGQMAVAFDMRGRECGAQFEGPHDTANMRAANGGSSRSYVADQWAVRRLLPIECEDLQGIPSGFTAIPYKRRKIAADEAGQCAVGGAKIWQDDTGQWFTDCMADGNRYKMIGNGMAVPVIRWILQRVDMQVRSSPPDAEPVWKNAPPRTRASELRKVER